MSYAPGCDACEAKAPGHDVLDPREGFIFHRQSIASGEHWAVEVTAVEGPGGDGYKAGFDEHRVVVHDAPDEWRAAHDLVALSSALATAAVRLQQVYALWDSGEYVMSREQAAYDRGWREGKRAERMSNGTATGAERQMTNA